MPEDEKKKTSWVDIGVKIVPPIVTGILIAWAGFVGNMVLSSISNKQESARLITELQVKREQAECELRKDVFDQALEAFLLKKEENLGTLNDLSRQMLRLELLALNFGDSLSLSPLFIELKSNLTRAEPANEEDISYYDERKAKLRERLDSLAKRVARSQLSSIAQHGKTKPIEIPLYEYKKEGFKKDCKKTLWEERDYAWPSFRILKEMMLLDEDYNPVNKEQNKVDSFIETDLYNESMQESSLIELNGIKRYLQLHVSDINHCSKTAEVQILITDESGKYEVDRSFTLDYFNFPMVDNTRLSHNQRFALVMEAFELKVEVPMIEIMGVIFPSEYASLRDRPGMQEARKLLESAMESGKDDK